MSANLDVNANNVNQNKNYNNNKECCSCSENTKFWLKIIFCPCYMCASTFFCF